MAKTDYGDVEEGVSMTKEVTRKNKRDAEVPGAGWYVHPESGQRAIVQDDPLWGNTQAQAFARLGFKFERPATADEIKTLPELAADTRKQEEGTLKGLSARLDVLENTNAEQGRKLESTLDENKSLKEEIAALHKQLESAEEQKKVSDKADAAAAKQEAKSEQEAADHVAEAGKSQVTSAQDASAEQAKANAVRVTEEREDASGLSQNLELKNTEQDAQSRSEEEVKAKADAEKAADKTNKGKEGK